MAPVRIVTEADLGAAVPLDRAAVACVEQAFASLEQCRRLGDLHHAIATLALSRRIQAGRGTVFDS